LSKRRRLAYTLGFLFVFLCAAPFLAGAFHVSAGSMEDTIHAGEKLIISRGILTSLIVPNLRRNDIVAFHSPQDARQIFIKRIVGVPGDRIRIANKALFLNGHRVNEPWAVHKTAFIDDKRDNTPELLVPPGQYFVLGDNRDNSLDSRYFGLVSDQDIVGQVLFAYWPAPVHRIR